MKNILVLIIFLFYFFFIKSQMTEINSNTVEMILKDDELIYTTEELNTINVYDLIKKENIATIYQYNITRSKTLINLSDKKFILFGLNTEGILTAYIYDDTSNNANSIKFGSLELLFTNNMNFSIRKVTEDIFIITYINGDNCNIFMLEKGNEPKGGLKHILDKNNKNVNTLECDSFDGINIFCVYSLTWIESGIFNIECFYSFSDINTNSLEKNEIKFKSIKQDIASFAKIEENNEKKFILCFTKTSRSPDPNNPININKEFTIYCQFFVQNDNEVQIDNYFTIGEISNNVYMSRSIFTNNIPIKIKVYDYSIFLFFEVTQNGDEKHSLLYVDSLDFGLNILDRNFAASEYYGDQNILINDKYRIVYKRISSGKTTIEYAYLKISCSEQLFKFNIENQVSGIDIRDNIINNSIFNDNYYYISFSIDLLTYLYINNERSMGGLLYENAIQNIQKINLKYNKNLVKSNIYYIFYTKDEDFNYITSTNFCLFNALNCYETCIDCNSDIAGNEEKHQCSSCITNYYKYENELNENGFYNCYKKDDPIIQQGIYFDEKDQFYHKCDISCKKCDNGQTCIICNDGYYFKSDSVEGNNNTGYKLNDKCYKTIPEHNYYLDTNSNFNYNNKIIEFVYKKCYITCYSCITKGDSINNGCSTCANEYINYPFDSTKCTVNKNLCQFWEVDNDKNVKCINKCQKFLIYEDTNQNRNQCVENCQSYFNPYETKQTEPLLIYNCDSYKLCITLELCKAKRLNYDNIYCYPPSTGCVNLDIYVPPEIDTTETDKETDWLISSDNIEIKNKVKFIKMFNFENIEYSNISNNFIVNQTNRYINELDKELEIHKGEYLNGIDFITLSIYKDFSITFYPIDSENYVYKNLLEINNLCFINFTKYFKEINYKITNKNYTILISLIEHKNINLPINSLNYFAILYDEVNNRPVKIINMTKNSSDIVFENSYILNNFENSEINEKYSIKLINTIKYLYNKDKNIIFYNKHNKLFNDICYIYTSEQNTDMTIEDRIKEYYLEINFCENDCSLIRIYDKEESKSPRALCNCYIKDNLNINDENYLFNKKDNYVLKKSNVNALKCGKEVFSKRKISSNPLFWIFIIFIFIEVLLIINILSCGKSSIENLLKLKKHNNYKENNNSAENNIINNDIENIDKCEKIEIIINNDNDNKDKKILKLSKNEFKNNKFKSLNLIQNIKSSVQNIDDYKKEIILTSPNNFESNPPKRKISNENIKSKRITNNLITGNKNSNNETSLPDSRNINYENKNSTFEDIFDDNDERLKNNYLIKDKSFIENNYLVFGRKQILTIIKNNLKPLNQEEFNKYKLINTNYDINDEYNPFRRGNLILSEIEYKRKCYSDGEDYPYIMPNNFSKIKNNYTKKISRFSKLFGGDSDMSGEEKLFQPDNLVNTKNNLIDEDKNKKSDDEENEVKENINIDKEIGDNENNKSKDSNSNNNSNTFIKVSRKKQLSYDFKIHENKNLNNSSNDINLSFKDRTNINLKSINSELLKKNNKKEGNIDQKKKLLRRQLLKNSLNMSLNSNNNLLNSKRNFNDNEDYNKNKKSENYFNIQNKNSENEEIIFNKKNLVSSISTLYENDNSLELFKTKNCINIYWDYFIKREIILSSFYNKYDNIAYFIRISTFLFVISFIFMVNSLLLTSSDIHKRYIYAKDNKKINEIKYIFKYEFSKIFGCTIISLMFKMLSIKFFYGSYFFKILNETKKDIAPFTEKNLNNKEYNELNEKRKKYIKKYLTKSIIFVSIQFVFIFIFGFISICYIGTFPNTFGGIIGRFFISFIFSIIICALICLISILLYQCGLITCFNFIKKIY